MKHHGNVTKINGAVVEPVDIITFGSPCQDLSVAGKRAGIQDGERSNLFFEAVRIIKEMRDSTNGEYPKYAVWENVPGAFSSNKGHDFHAVLEALCSVCDDTVSIPKPYDKRKPDKLIWNGAGEIVGDNYSLCWRTLDAQYWGVPQRRKRIYLVADFTGRRAGEILFKPDSLRGYMPQGNEAGQGATVDAVGSVDGGVGTECLGSAGFDVSMGAKAGNIGYESEIAPTLNAGKVMSTVFSFDSLSSNSMKSSNPFSGCRAVDVAKCIDTTYPDPSKNQGGVAVVQPLVLKERAGCDGGGKGALWSDKAFTLATNQDMSVIALQANGIDRADTAGCNGAGWRENESYTLNTVDRHAVCYGIDHVITTGGNCTAQGSCVYEDTQATLKAGGVHAVCYDARGNGDGETACFTMQRSDEYQDCAVASTQSARQYKSATDLVVEKKRRYIIRRLTPAECARLQGFPDKWGHLAPYDPADADFWEEVRKTHAEINGKKYKPVKDVKKWYDKLHTDSAEYKAYGNGLALPCAENVMRGIAEAMRNEKGQFVSEGGITEHKGYTCIYKPDHPRARANGYVREHILVAEEMLGRPLDENEVVHHINGDKSDNRPENLMVFPNQNEHVKYHNRTDGTKYKYRDGEYTIAELAEFSAVDYATLTQRINKLKWDIGKAVETPKRGQPTLGSLFDGIGGFPLAGAMNGIIPLWSSEIEPYPIAVTVSRFGGTESI